MNKLYLSLVVAIVLLSTSSFSQNITNRGKEFWVGYGHHQFMENGDNSQDMTLYFSTEADTAYVTVSIDSSGTVPGSTWKRVYKVLPFSSISTATTVAISYNPASIGPTGAIPKTGSYNSTLWDPAINSEGIFRRKGVHIQSTVSIIAYAHIYGSVSSGATVLMPTDTWGYEYMSVNSKQQYSANCFSWLFVVAQSDSTLIEIIPSVPTRNGKTPNLPFYITLQKGQIYQIMGAIQSGVIGYELTGSRVTSVTGKKIAVFSGSSRTSNPCSTGSGGGDNDIQQLFPQQSWGKKYLTAPTSSSTTPSTFMTNIYKIIVADSTTIVTKNGIALTGLINGSYYTYESSTADYIEANKPIMVGQFISGGCLGGNLGDPEMFYVSPIEQKIKRTAFCRTNLEGINFNYATIIIPTNGLSSLKIDGISFASIPSTDKHSYTHPNLSGYSVAVKKWASAQTYSTIESDSSFNGVTYGLGPVESYGFNIGAHIDSIGPAGFRLGQILPVTFNYFNALRSNKDVLVNWQTLSEINTDKFEIERSTDGSSFEKAGTVTAKNAESNYSFNDINAVTNNTSFKALYYRLKVIDKDGSFKYSKIARVDLSKNLRNEITVFPNPFTTSIKVAVAAEKEGKATISVKDITGRNLISKTVSVVKGSNQVNVNEVSNLSKGMYIVTVELNGSISQMKIMK